MLQPEWNTWDMGSELSPSDGITAAIKKERTIKEFLAAQGALQVLGEKVESVQHDIEKLRTGNATLQMYIDNLTMQLARQR